MEVLMAFHWLSLRERFIGVGLLRPADQNEMFMARQRCSTYLLTLAFAGIRATSASDARLTIAVLERWYSL
jgi:hypothetical protein